MLIRALLLAALLLPATAFAQAGETVEISQAPARSWLGMAMQSNMRLEAGLQYIEPPVITSVAQGSPAAAAGLRVGDEILAIDGCDLREACVNWRQLVPGQRYRLRVRSGGREREATLVPAPPRGQTREF